VSDTLLRRKFRKHPSKSSNFIVDELGGQFWYDFWISKIRIWGLNFTYLSLGRTIAPLSKSFFSTKSIFFQIHGLQAHPLLYQVSPQVSEWDWHLSPKCPNFCSFDLFAIKISTLTISFSRGARISIFRVVLAHGWNKKFSLKDFWAKKIEFFEFFFPSSNLGTEGFFWLLKYRLLSVF
jgi:hypothetical protein